MPEVNTVSDANPEAVFETKVDLGATMDVRAAELRAADESGFPSEIRVDVSVDDRTWTQAADLSRVKWPGAGKTVEIDLRTVGSELPARYVRFRFRHPPARRTADGDTWYQVALPGMRLRVAQ